MNMLNIGMDMSQILLPQVKMQSYYDETKGDNQQVNSSSIYSYLNIRGLGRTVGGQVDALRYFNAIPYLGYWDIYKNYYANKQEERGFVIHAEDSNAFKVLSATLNTRNSSGVATGNSPYDVAGTGTTGVDTSLTTAYEVELVISVKNGDVVEGLPNANDIIVAIDGTDVYAVDVFDNVVVGGIINGAYAITFNYYVGVRGSSQSWAVAQIYVANDIPDGQGLPQLVEFPLDNIDNMRMDILEAVRDTTAFVIDKTSASPYGLGLDYTGNIDAGTAEFYKTASQEGLGIKTYQSDLFNNWISTEWIDGSNGINEVTAVSTAGDEFTIDSLNLANKVYNMLNRIAISGGSYDDWLDAVYTH
jgi:hypothetical protein